MAINLTIDRVAFGRDGFAHLTGVLPAEHRDRLIAELPIAQAGRRLPVSSPELVDTVAVVAPLLRSLQPALRPVRCVYFDKSAASNWAVPWHQDRTIAVEQRREVPGFGPWSVKQGVPHVEPPFYVLADMITVRLHLDDCPHDNAPLLVVRGSHHKRYPENEVAAIVASGTVTTCLAVAGDVWIYATPIVHASRRAEQPVHRRVLQIDFCAAELPSGLAWAA